MTREILRLLVIDLLSSPHGLNESSFNLLHDELLDQKCQDILEHIDDRVDPEFSDNSIYYLTEENTVKLLKRDEEVSSEKTV